MTDGRTKAVVEGLRERLFTVNGIIALAVLLVLIIGFFLGSPVGRIICAVIFVLGTVYLFLVGRREKDMSVSVREEHKEELYPQPP